MGGLEFAMSRAGRKNGSVTRGPLSRCEGTLPARKDGARFTPDIESRLNRLKVDQGLRSLLAEGFAGLPVTVGNKSAEYVGLSAPNGSIAAYVYPAYVDLDLESKVAHRLVEWHGELRLVPSPKIRTEQNLRVRGTDLASAGVRQSVLEALPGAFTLSESRLPLAEQRARPVRAPRPVRETRVARPAASSAVAAQSWEAPCDKCMMTHRIGVEC